MLYYVQQAPICVAFALLLAGCDQHIAASTLPSDATPGASNTTAFASGMLQKSEVGSFTWLADRPTAAVSQGMIQLHAATHDLAGLPYAGAQLTFGVQGANATLSSTHGVTDANGQVSVYLRATRAGAFVAAATLGSDTRSVRVSFTRACAGLHFAAAHVVPVNSSGAHSLAHGDMDADGDVDLVVEIDAGHVKTMLNDGHGTFSVSDAFAGDAVNNTGDGLAPILADMNGDGQPDVVTSLYSNPTGGVGIYPNAGQGRLAPMLTVACGGDQRPTLADLDGDGSVDIAASKLYGNVVSACFNNSYPYGFAITGALVPGGNGGNVAVADYDGDGRLDMVVGNSNGTSYSRFFNQGIGAWGPATALEVGTTSFHAASADLNGDGAPDVALCNAVDGNARVLLNDGAGGLGGLDVYAGIVGCVLVQAADLNGDGAPELALATTNGNNIAILPNAGAGIFGAPVLIDAGGTGPAYLLVDDFDADGAPDLAAAVGSGVSILINQCD